MLSCQMAICTVWRSVVGKLAPPSGGSAGCSDWMQTEPGFTKLLDLNHKYLAEAGLQHETCRLYIWTAWGRKKFKSNTFLMSLLGCIFHHQRMFSKRGGWKTNYDEQLWYLSVTWRFLPGFISFLVCKHHCFCSQWGERRLRCSFAACQIWQTPMERNDRARGR